MNQIDYLNKQKTKPQEYLVKQHRTMTHIYIYVYIIIIVCLMMPVQIDP